MNPADYPVARRRTRSGAGRAIIAIGTVLLVALFLALGIWQIERRSWKHQLIAAVDSRIHAAPVAAPSPADWPSVDATRDAYRRIRITGRFLHDRATFVQATTDLGAGYWVLTPLDTGDAVILVNRGFVPPDKRGAGRTGPNDQVTITGLLRVSEPGGGFLRSNDPAADRWYSRDVAAIARSRHLGKVAPFFIDAEASPTPGSYPVGGLTVIRFNDNHLMYALTWFAMAALSVLGGWLMLRDRESGDKAAT